MQSIAPDYSKKDHRNEPCCFPPTELYTIAYAIGLILYEKMTICELDTIVNLLTMLTANLTGLIDQDVINEGLEVEPPF